MRFFACLLLLSVCLSLSEIFGDNKPKSSDLVLETFSSHFFLQSSGS